MRFYSTPGGQISLTVAKETTGYISGMILSLLKRPFLFIKYRFAVFFLIKRSLCKKIYTSVFQMMYERVLTLSNEMMCSKKS